MRNNKKNIVFMGTPEFAVPSLTKLNEQYGITAVVTVPDKPQGRGKKMLPSAVKLKAIELGIPILQPVSLKDEDFIRKLREFNPDIIVVIAFRILPVEVYESAKIAAFNIHGSLLPKYRGAAPINWAIINGEKTTGLTSFILQEKVDTGEMLLQKSIEIQDGTTAGDLHDFLMPIAADLATDTCEILFEGNYVPQKQDDIAATPAPKIFPEQCKIDWNVDARKVRNFIHGVSPHPGAWCIMNNKRLKLLRCNLEDYTKPPSSFQIKNGKLIVACAEKSISITQLQLEGKKTMYISDFLNGYKGPTEGTLL